MQIQAEVDWDHHIAAFTVHDLSSPLWWQPGCDFPSMQLPDARVSKRQVGFRGQCESFGLIALLSVIDQGEVCVSWANILLSDVAWGSASG